MSDDLVKRAEIKSGMLKMGEPIAFGSDAAVIDELITRIRDLEAQLKAVNDDILPFKLSKRVLEGRAEELKAQLKTRNDAAWNAAIEKAREVAERYFPPVPTVDTPQASYSQCRHFAGGTISKAISCLKRT